MNANISAVYQLLFSEREVDVIALVSYVAAFLAITGVQPDITYLS